MPARLLGRALKLEQDTRASDLLRPEAAFRPQARMLHLDPFTVLHCRLQAEDAVLCHDLGPITHPGLFAPDVQALYRRAYRLIADRRPRMIFVSQASRHAFTAHYGEWAGFRVIYPPLRREVMQDRPAFTPNLPSRFLLTVGSIGDRKNQRACIDAFARSGLADEGFTYILCGGREPGAEAVAEYAVHVRGVQLLSYVSDDELARLYARAAGFVLVSRLEGFGVPVAEAIARGLVPLVTEGSVLREVAGAGALAAMADDPAAIAHGMRALAHMPPAERESRRAALAASIARFSPANFASHWREFLTVEPEPARATATAPARSVHEV